MSRTIDRAQMDSPPPDRLQGLHSVSDSHGRGRGTEYMHLCHPQQENYYGRRVGEGG